MTNRYVTSPDSVRSESDTHYPSPDGQDQEPHYRLMRLCQCEECEGTGKYPFNKQRCTTCRGEGRTLEEVARCDTPQDLGVALVTLALEDEFDGCPIGIIDSQGETGRKWLIRPWLASPRNISDAARTLAKSKGEK